MSTKLSPEYYQEVCSNKHEDPDNKNNEFTYTGYQSKFGYPMALYSKKTGLPLATLILLFQDQDNYKKGHNSFITELPSENKNKQYFQGAVTNNNQKIEFVITNLCEDYINFNLMKCDKKVTNVNPNGLNEINELSPYESYAIRCDQTDSNKIIMLKAFEKNTESGSKNVKLKDEMAQTSTDKVGSYIYLSVVPKYGNKNLEENFAQTFWKPVDFFVVKRLEVKEVKYKSYSQFCNFDAAPQPELASVKKGASGGYKLTAAKQTEYLSDSDGDTGDEFEFDSNADYGERYASHDVKTKTAILESKVGNIVSGDETLTVKSVETGIMYNYDLQSMPCVLGLSVMEDFKLVRPPSEIIKQDLEELIKSYINNTYQSIISQIKTFTSDNCCVCLTEKPNGTFYRCGHKCTDKDCAKQLNKCPLCRTFISAFVTS